jgi:hypothetical protein
MVFKSLLSHHDKLKMHFVELEAKDIEQLDGQFQRGRFNKRINISIGDLSWQAGIVALGGGAGYVSVSKERMKKLGLHLGDEVSFLIEADDSEFGLEMAKNFTEILRQDPEVKERFKQYEKGVQRYMLYYVLQVK